MIRSLRDFVGKDVLLLMGAEAYTGKVIGRERYSQSRGGARQMEYFFQTSDGEIIPIGKRNLTSESSGLTLRLNVIKTSRTMN